ncbi:MAG: nucleotidyltransferase family protein [Bacteroidales bacterium]|jgi:hypothetical protein|nr:nucleotidyltransferase family protein [Bacteroidales bacterium]
MPLITSFSQEILRRRHGLSAYQINSLFGEKVYEDSIEEKIIALNKVAEFIRITDVLTSEHIWFIPLKGPVLSYRIYGDVTVREYCDLDLMVELSSVQRSADLLVGLGYEPVGYQLPAGRSGQQIAFSHVHHILFIHRAHNLRIELHWRLFQSTPVRLRKLNDLVAANLSKITFEGRSFRVLSAEFELLYLVMHGGIHSWRRLKWLNDVYEFLNNTGIDWEKFRVLALELRASRLISLANFVLAEFYPEGPSIPLKNEAIPFMKSYAIRQINEVNEPEQETLDMKMDRLRFSFHCYPGLRYKFRRVCSATVFYLYHAFRKVDRTVI